MEIEDLISVVKEKRNLRNRRWKNSSGKTLIRCVEERKMRRLVFSLPKRVILKARHVGSSKLTNLRAEDYMHPMLLANCT